jgi:two-component system, OmpR family, heavy metal sensor histidine kinase CusS
MGSIRRRLLIGTSLASAVVLSLLGLGIYAAMRHALMRDFDNSLRTEARLVAGMVEQDGNKLSFEFQPQQMPDFLSDSRERFFEVWRDDGSALARSPSLGNHDLDHSTMGGSIGGTLLPDGHSGRAVVIAFVPDQEDQEDNQPGIKPHSVSIAVAGEPIDVQRTLALLAWLLMGLCAAAVVVMGIILLRVVGRGMQPIRTLAGEIGSLSEMELDRRLSSEIVPDELTPMVDKLNGLLIRLEQAFIREKSFTADVAHELRTPIAGLRSTLEVCRSRQREIPEYESAIDECRGITDRMEAMVESLLLLARSDAGQLPIDRREFDLGCAVTEGWNQFAYRAQRRGLKVALEIPTDCTAISDPDKLQIVLQNVFDNAVSYADEGGRIRIAIRSDGREQHIEIANTGSLIAAEETPRLFERFWRGDVARSDVGLHCGLGLSLSQRIMERLDCRISIQSVKGGEFIVRLKIPADQPPIGKNLSQNG